MSHDRQGARMVPAAQASPRHKTRLMRLTGGDFF